MWKKMLKKFYNKSWWEFKSCQLIFFPKELRTEEKFNESDLISYIVIIQVKENQHSDQNRR